MSNITVTFFGAKESGKTSLIDRLINKRFVSSEKLKVAVGYPADGTPVFYSIVHLDKAKLQIWDVSDRIPPQYRDLKKAYLKNCHVCVCTLDLSQSFNEKEFAADIQLIKESAPDTAILLVGCKGDTKEENLKINNELLEKIKKDYDLDYAPIITSAKDDHKVNELFAAIANLGQFQKAKNYIDNPKSRSNWLNEPSLDAIKLILKPDLPLYNAVASLENLIAELPNVQKKQVTEAVIKLIIDLRDPKTTDKNPVIQQFLENCEAVLQEASTLGVSKEVVAKISQGIVVVAAASTMTVLLGSLIFGLGLGTLLLGGIIGATIAYNLSKQGFFKPQQLNCVLDQIREPTNNVDDNFIQDPFQYAPEEHFTL